MPIAIIKMSRQVHQDLGVVQLLSMVRQLLYIEIDY